MDVYNTTSIDKYLSGTIYPGIQKLTNMGRDSTHNRDILSQRSYQNDFFQGWLVHCICDEIQWDVYKLFFAELGSFKDKKNWPYLTALKLIQDKYDAEHINMQEFIPLLNNTENPNSEDIRLIMKYNGAIQKAYKEKDVSLESYSQMFIEHGLTPDIARKTIDISMELMNNPSLVSQIRNVYPEMISLFRISI